MFGNSGALAVSFGIMLFQNTDKMNPYLWIPIIAGCLLLVVIAIPVIRLISKLYIGGMGALKSMFAKKRVKKMTGIEKLDKVISAAGYSYDPHQDIFFSTMGAWQRHMGFCSMYDEAAAPLGMIIDCEPIRFEYGGKRWLIEFWKGQYDMTTGGEIGIYTTTQPDIHIPGVFNGPFYDSAGNTDLLSMYFILKKKGKILFTRQGRHWWLTGFKLGEFSQPSDLSMYLKITFKNVVMLGAFLKGLMDAGYSQNEIFIHRNTIALEFNKPRSRQPKSRTEVTDQLIQNKNRLLCERYQEITSPYDNLPDKAKAIQRESPEIYKHLQNIGKNEQLFWNHAKIQNYVGGSLSKNAQSSLFRAFESAQQIEYNDNSKFVIMSDCHRGDGSAADDFAKNKSIFYAALSQYYNKGYNYIEIGDGDECWENRKFSDIANKYSDIFSLLNKYHNKGMLYLIYGNHDMVKKYPKFISDLSQLYDRYMPMKSPLFQDIKIHEGLVLKHDFNGSEIFLVHGHQVDYLNDKLWKLSRFLVRYFWRPLEFFGINDPTRTAKNYRKKDLIDKRLTEWVIRENRMLIAGHTHRPMFPDTGQPPYFNDGSCVHPQGITGIEIEYGYIKLVKWIYKRKSDGTLYISKEDIAGPTRIDEYFK